MARLTEEIAGRGAKVIGYDFLFAEADRQAPQDFARLYPELSAGSANEISGLPSMDAVFARVVGRTPVVLARAGVEAESFDSGPTDVAQPGPVVLPPDVKFEGPVPSAIPSYAGLVTNLEILDGAARRWAMVWPMARPTPMASFDACHCWVGLPAFCRQAWLLIWCALPRA